MIFNVSNGELESMQANAKEFTDEANAWLASLDTDELLAACERKECVISFNDFPEEAKEAKEAIYNNLINRMAGKDAELSFNYGMAGSIWFDCEVNIWSTSGKHLVNNTRPVRVALVPPGNEEFDSVSPKPRHVFSVLCLKQMYS